MTILFVAFLACTGAGALAGALMPRRGRVLASAALLIGASSFALALAGRVLSTGSDFSWSRSTLLPLGGLALRLSPLGALFVILSGLVAAASSLYWIGYAHHSLNSRSASTAFCLFVLGLLAVPMAGNVTTFLFAWELMALSSLALVAHDHARRRDAIAAARWYAVMTQGGAVAITFSLAGLAAHAHSTSFVRIARPPRGSSVERDHVKSEPVDTTRPARTSAKVLAPISSTALARTRPWRGISAPASALAPAQARNATKRIVTGR